MQKVLAVMAILGLTITFNIKAQSKVGTTAGNFLTIPVGPRATAMGGAFVAAANDVSALYWNAGGLSRLKDNETAVSHAKWLVGTNHNWFGLALKIDGDNSIGLSINQLDYGDEEITTERRPDGTGQSWNAADIAIGLSYARNLTDRFSIGGTLKYINQKIWNETASCFALDVGLVFITQLDGMRLGMNISNFGTEMRMEGKDLREPVDIDPSQTGNNSNIVSMLETDSWNLPLIFSLGLSYDMINSGDWKIMAAADAVYPNNNNKYMNAGTEIVWSNLLSLRTGYHTLFNKESEEGFSIGLGLNYSFSSISAKIDYSYMDFGVFSGISRYGVSVSF